MNNALKFLYTIPQVLDFIYNHPWHTLLFAVILILAIILSFIHKKTPAEIETYEIVVRDGDRRLHMKHTRHHQ